MINESFVLIFRISTLLNKPVAYPEYIQEDRLRGYKNVHAQLN